MSNWQFTFLVAILCFQAYAHAFNVMSAWDSPPERGTKRIAAGVVVLIMLGVAWGAATVLGGYDGPGN